jgi:hypothetical protein
MQTYDVIRVMVTADNDTEVDNRQAEVERYLYGRHFYLGRRPSDLTPNRRHHELFFLVESHYTHQIIPRLASGLLWGSVADPEAYAELGF